MCPFLLGNILQQSDPCLKGLLLAYGLKILRFIFCQFLLPLSPVLQGSCSLPGVWSVPKGVQDLTRGRRHQLTEFCGGSGEPVLSVCLGAQKGSCQTNAHQNND